jgi:hypothetical protein
MRYVRITHRSNPNAPSFFFGKGEEFITLDAAQNAASKWIESQENRHEYSSEICYTSSL